jgi:16S rRNA (cytidine1402-2'-O)-methyltransferase
LGELSEVFPERQVVLARELTKKFEEFLRGKPAELLVLTQKRTLKGEFVILIEPRGESDVEAAPQTGGD